MCLIDDTGRGTMAVYASSAPRVNSLDLDAFLMAGFAFGGVAGDFTPRFGIVGFSGVAAAFAAAAPCFCRPGDDFAIIFLAGTTAFFSSFFGVALAFLAAIGATGRG